MDVSILEEMSTLNLSLSIIYTGMIDLQAGAREPGGGARGAIAPPNFLSQWDGYACAPPKIWQSL